MNASVDVAELAQSLAYFLAPFLPDLVGKVGDALAEVTVEKSLKAAWERAQGVWGKLHPKVESTAAAKEAALDVAQNPDDEDAQAALWLQLKKLLAADTALATELGELWEEAKQASATVSAIGEGSVAIGRDASGMVIIEGDRNVVQQGKYNVNIGKAESTAIGDDVRVDVSGEST
ncbi:MAG TPA: hypothetical protein VM537_08390 [Anaerolineae bacterium]|nr:hypothetical protein [Anaerolineae bacterium]